MNSGVFAVSDLVKLPRKVYSEFDVRGSSESIDILAKWVRQNS